MCGFTGLVGFGNNTEDVRKMTQRIAHRGPDAEGWWNDDVCSLGHRRLSIIDLSEAANQPMISHCGRYVMAYNGEIYNFRQIRDELGRSMNTTSDTEVILEAFAGWGPGFVHRLNGMFAIAIWDIQEKKLHLFRDRMGIKPLYYYHDGSEFAFASELKALTANQKIASTLSIDMQAVQYFLHLGVVPEPYSIFGQIRKFPKGSYAVFSGGQLSITTYWKPEEKIQASLLSDEQEATERLKTLLTESVRMRLMSDVPYGTFLSGGIDSSLVTAVAQSLLGEQLNTFTIGLSDEMFNEAGHARKISEYLGTRHHDFIISEQDALEQLPGLNDIFDEPFADSSAIPTLLVSQMSRRHVTMTLSGDGGDELFFGYGAYQWAQRLHYPFLKTFRRPVRDILRMGSSRMRRASWLFDTDKNTGIRPHIFSQEQYLFSEAEVRNMTGRLFESSSLCSYEKLIPDRDLTSSELQALFDIKYYLADDLLVKVDRASMYHSLETRVPLLDYRIAEFALNLSPELKYRNKQRKYLLKKVLYQYLPPEFFARPKRGFSIPLAKWMRGSLNEYMMDYLHSEKLMSLLQLNIDDIPAVRKWKSGDDLYYNRVWQLVVLSKWLDSEKMGR